MTEVTDKGPQGTAAPGPIRTAVRDLDLGANERLVAVAGPIPERPGFLPMNVVLATTERLVHVELGWFGRVRVSRQWPWTARVQVTSDGGGLTVRAEDEQPHRIGRLDADEAASVARAARRWKNLPNE